MGRFTPGDFSQGDPDTVGGYRAVHGRPPAFEGADGASYSVEIVCDEIDASRDPEHAYGAYLLFVRWREHDPVAVGHLETGYLGLGSSEEEATVQVAMLSLQEARAHLDDLIRSHRAESVRRSNGDSQ